MIFFSCFVPASPPKIFMNITVPNDDAAMFTILFPINIVDINLSYLSDNSIARFAFLSPFSAIALSFVLFKDEKAVSVAEKYAEQISNITIITIYVDVLKFKTPLIYIYIMILKSY